MDEAGFRFLWTGDAPAAELAWAYDPGATPRLGAAQLAELEPMLARRAAAGQVLQRRDDGSLPDLYRLVAWRARGAALRLELGRTDYATYLLTNLEHPGWRAELGPQAMADPLAATLVLVTADGRVPFGRRSARIFDSRATWHLLPAGHPEPPAPFLEGLLREARDEAGIEPRELAELRCTSLLRSEVTGKPELTFRARAAVPCDELLARERPEAWEFDELRSLAWAPDAVAAWLARHGPEAAPPARAALLAAARAAFGPGWQPGA